MPGEGFDYVSDGLLCISQHERALSRPDVFDLAGPL